jgi:hypothetical protein
MAVWGNGRLIAVAASRSVWPAAIQRSIQPVIKRYRTLQRERRVLTDEASGNSTVADVETCSPPVFADPTGPVVTIDCTEVRETYRSPALNPHDAHRCARPWPGVLTWETSTGCGTPRRPGSSTATPPSGSVSRQSLYRTRTWLNLSQALEVFAPVACGTRSERR